MEFPYLLAFTQIASTEGFLIATGVIVTAFLFQRDARNAVALFASAAGLILTINLLKELFRIPRPVDTLIEVTGYAFPSGHAAGAAFLAVIVGYLSRNLHTPLRYLVYVACLLGAFAIGFSRITFNVHTPLQMTAGFAIGIFFAFVFTRFSSEKQ